MAFKRSHEFITKEDVNVYDLKIFNTDCLFDSETDSKVMQISQISGKDQTLAIQLPKMINKLHHTNR